MSTPHLPTGESGNRSHDSVDLLDTPTTTVSFRFKISEKRRATDPGPGQYRHWIPAHHDGGPSTCDLHSIDASAESSCSQLTIPSCHIQDGKCCNCLALLKSLKKRMKRLDTHSEKLLLLTTVPEHLVQNHTLTEVFGCSPSLEHRATELRRTLGQFSRCPPEFIDVIPKFIKTSIADFFMDPDNSGQMKVTKGGKRAYQQAMLVSLSELFQEYIHLYPFNRRTVSYSRFAMLIPRNIVWSKPFYGNTQDETCIIHENFQLLLSACYIFSAEGITNLLNDIVCSNTNPICMLGYCEHCKISGKVAQLTSEYGPEERVEFYTWQKLPSGDYSSRDILTLVMITEPLQSFNERLITSIRGFFRHHFILEEQNQYWDQISSNLSDDWTLALVKMDFCEPFNCVSKVGSKSSQLISYDPHMEVALHPFHVTYFDVERNRIDMKNFVVVSNDLRETANTSFLFRREMIQWMRRTLPQIKTLVYWSDDNRKNFKNERNLINLLFHEEDFKMKASHEFTVEGHAAQECTDLVSMIKQRCRRACLSGEARISSALDMGKYCKKKLTVAGDLEFGFLDRRVGRIRNLEARLDRRYMVSGRVFPAVDEFFSFRPDYSRIPGRTDTIRVRRLSGSNEFQVIRVMLTEVKEDKVEDLTRRMFSQKYSWDQWDEWSCRVGNIITFSVEEVLFSGKIVGDPDVVKGKLEVLMMGRIERVNAGRRIGEVYFEEGRIVQISTLDVVLVENENSIAETTGRTQEGSGRGWGDGARKLLTGLGRKMMGGGGSLRM